MTRTFSLALVWFAAIPSLAQAQGLEYIQGNYTKYEYRIPMRDGVKLFTSVYVPKDSSRRYPFMLSRTPYSVAPYGVDRFKTDLGPSPLFGKSGYIFAYQDVRGRYMSEGEFVNMRPHKADKKGRDEIDESSDTFDTIDWLIKQVPGHNGKVGMWGISYPGFYTAAGMIDAHPALKAASPQAPVTDWFVGDDWHHNGAFFLPHAFGFMAGFGKPRPVPTAKPSSRYEPETPDGYRFFLDLGPLSNVNSKYFKDEIAFWNEIMKHGTYDDFWKARNLRPHLKNIKPAVMTVGGWFDAENLFGALETYKNVERSSPGAANVLVMGPWSHGGWSRSEGGKLNSVAFRSKTAEFYRENIEFPFFEHILKQGRPANFPEAWVFETGTDQWRTFDAWPPAKAEKRSLFPRSAGALSFEAPGESETAQFDEYAGDPAKPVPYLGTVTFGMAGDYMAADQRQASHRPDVLVYQTSVLEDDVTIVGPIKVSLFVESTGTDADFVVKLIDVYPDSYPDPEPNPEGVHMGGYQQLVRGDVMRAKFRSGFDNPTALVPGKPEQVDFTMPDVLHTFRPGHRVMVQVQSSWFPLVDRNPQTFVDIYSAKESDFKKATQRVYHSAERASRLDVLILP